MVRAVGRSGWVCWRRLAMPVLAGGGSVRGWPLTLPCHRALPAYWLVAARWVPVKVYWITDD